jgi:hypothetical protein
MAVALKIPPASSLPQRTRGLLFAVALLLTAAALQGCASQTASAGHSASRSLSGQRERIALESYLRQVEPIRLAVNSLLDGADPILSANHDHGISPRVASQRMSALERRFAVYTVDMAAIQPATAQLRAVNAPYAHTYILEDSYLSALASGLTEQDLDDLPDTSSEQRAAIVQWRTGLTVLARRAGVRLPADLQVAGRGEIRPSPDGS